MRYTFLILALFFGLFATSAQVRKKSARSFVLKGIVVEDDTNKPIAKVNVETDDGEYTTTNAGGQFSISAEIGDELTIKSDAFKTVYYTIKDEQDITVRVQKAEEEPYPVTTAKDRSTSNSTLFKTYIDSANYFLKTDAAKSIGYVTKALQPFGGTSASKEQTAIAFETLGDINIHWGQPDLAIDNFKRSISEKNTIDRRIKLAKAFMRNRNYQESISAYKELLDSKLGNYQKVVVYEGLGDNYKATNDAPNSVANYQKGLSVAQKHLITPKITDLNSKIAEAYSESGAVAEATQYFDNSLTLAKKENPKRAVEEKNKVADFYNRNQNFDEEIRLRSETLDELEDIETDTIATNSKESSPLTPQRQNYYIANAYIAQDKYNEAIPYLERSINEAEANNDLVVEKDATRKLSEVYKGIGDFGKAAENYERYVAVVDELYIKKEQELSQATRFNKEIALKQNRITSLENERELNESRYKLAFENQELIQKNNKVQQWVIGSLVLVAMLLLFAAYTQYKSVKQQRFANNALALKSLRTQMNPHFIFNALNSVNSFIAMSDERAANKYLSEFSQLMRNVLENSDEDFIPLSKEIELLELYVKLEHFRFKDKFDHEITVDENLKISEFVIPPMLLQPYVENAVWHGLRYKEEKGHLSIDFKQTDTETVTITITDDGIGRKKSKALKTENQKKQKSKGMGNIQRRISILNEMYKDKVDVAVQNVFDNEEGTKVVLTLKKD
ncbi:histidine kinase [Marinirhabdus gelatinilytica]|uniref:Histidine kinase n=1 Tax=Marinirhabdus gelatinilytica TaxID=1703343 RepID=A0A370Q3S2_9FLAO|nr:histidine kinase [Marinirhabdus gelatinilytica]RDK83011.1 histidine kinase [Marinirhabdus gelatinilytica]